MALIWRVYLIKQLTKFNTPSLHCRQLSQWTVQDRNNSALWHKIHKKVSHFRSSSFVRCDDVEASSPLLVELDFQCRYYFQQPRPFPSIVNASLNHDVVVELERSMEHSSTVSKQVDHFRGPVRQQGLFLTLGPSNITWLLVHGKWMFVQL